MYGSIIAGKGGFRKTKMPTQINEARLSSSFLTLAKVPLSEFKGEFSQKKRAFFNSEI